MVIYLGGMHMELPADFCRRMEEMLGDDYGAFLDGFTGGTPHTAIRINPAKSGAREAVLNVTGPLEQVSWCADGYYAEKSHISGNHPYTLAGLLYFQEPSAMAAAEAADIQEGDRVLDLCAAPGGKSTHVLSKLAGTGLLAANEISKKRAVILAENVERFGAMNTIVMNETPERLEKKFAGFFDKIILDAPCSGEGMFRKEPQAIDAWSIAHTESCAARSAAIADSAVKMLRPGGRLVYSTCTFAPCENEGIAQHILTAHPNMHLIPIPQLDMLDAGCAAYIGSQLDLSFTRRIYPHRMKGEGHFVAAFRKDEAYADDVKVRDIKKNDRNALPDDAVKIYREFEKKAMSVKLDGRFVLFGENLYRLPDGIDSVDGLKVIRAGLHLGECKRGRFEPSRALVLALDRACFKNVLDLSTDSEDMRRYLYGETIVCDSDGWVCVCADGYPIGWGKCSQGTLKNHFPKHLRVKTGT